MKTARSSRGQGGSTPHPTSLREATFSRKGRRGFSSYSAAALPAWLRVRAAMSLAATKPNTMAGPMVAPAPG